MVITQFNYLDDSEFPKTIHDLLGVHGKQTATPIVELLVEVAQRFEANTEHEEQLAHGSDT